MYMIKTQCFKEKRIFRADCQEIQLSNSTPSSRCVFLEAAPSRKTGDIRDLGNPVDPDTTKAFWVQVDQEKYRTRLATCRE